MIRRPPIGAVLVAAIGIAAWSAAPAGAQTTWVVDARDPAPGINIWDPATLTAEPGDTVSWQFDEAGTSHNLFLKPPDTEPST